MPEFQDRTMRLHSAAEVARKLDVSKMTVLRWVAEGKVPKPQFHLRSQGRIVWLWSSVEFTQVLAIKNPRQQAKGRRV